MAKRTAASIQADIAKGAFRPHTALSNVALAYYQSDAKSFAKTIFPICPVSLSSDNYYIFDKEDLLRDNWQRKPAYGKVAPAVLSEHTETYACVVDQMIMGIDQIRQTDLSRRMGPRIADPKQQRTKTMAGQANIHQDAEFTRKYPPRLNRGNLLSSAMRTPILCLLWTRRKQRWKRLPGVCRTGWRWASMCLTH